MRTKKTKNGPVTAKSIKPIQPVGVYQVRREVGVPPITRNGRESQYPFADLEVGDGFNILSTRAKNVAMSARAYGKRTGTKFVVRRDPDLEGNHICVRSE